MTTEAIVNVQFRLSRRFVWVGNLHTTKKHHFHFELEKEQEVCVHRLNWCKIQSLHKVSEEVAGINNVCRGVCSLVINLIVCEFVSFSWCKRVFLFGVCMCENVSIVTKTTEWTVFWEWVLAHCFALKNEKKNCWTRWPTHNELESCFHCVSNSTESKISEPNYNTLKNFFSIVGCHDTVHKSLAYIQISVSIPSIVETCVYWDIIVLRYTVSLCMRRENKWTSMTSGHINTDFNMFFVSDKKSRSVWHERKHVPTKEFDRLSGRESEREESDWEHEQLNVLICRWKMTKLKRWWVEIELLCLLFCSSIVICHRVI